MTKVFKKVSIICVLLLMFSLSFTMYGCIKKDTSTEKKAIIMIPGFLGSLLYYENGDLAWDLNDNVLTQPNLKQSLKDVLTNDENNEVIIPLRPANMNDPDHQRYSFNRMYSKYYEYLNTTYDSEYDVLVWQYDWRQMNEISASKLEAMINEKGYTDVIFITHSMGGCVVAKYLNKAENRDKCKLFIAGAAPFFGSISATSFLYNGYDATSDATFQTIFKYIGLKDILINLGPVYQLLPNTLLNDTEIDGKKGTLTFDGEYKDWNGVYNELIKNVNFQKKDGTAKPALLNLKSYQDSDFINVDGQLKHVTDLVETEFIIGQDIRTLISVDYHSDTQEVTMERYCDGDGTVSVFSGLAGRDITDPHVNIINGVGHGSILERDISVETLKKILAKYDI